MGRISSFSFRVYEEKKTYHKILGDYLFGVFSDEFF